MEELITTGEMAARLHVSRQTIDQWIRAARTPRREIRVGQQVR